MGFKAIVFDFYGTLAHAEGSGVSAIDLAARRGYALPDAVIAKWNAGAWYELEHREHSASRDHYVRYRRSQRRQMFLDCGVPADDVEALLDDVDANDINFLVGPYPETVDVLTALRGRGVLLGICSNWDWDLDRGITTAGLAGLVDVEVSSARVGCRKPHPRIYEHTLGLLGADPAGTLFVGDTWDADVEGPLAVGMSAVHIHRGDHDLPTPELPRGAHRVTDLREVLDLVR